MAEEHFDVKVVGAKYICDECKTGEMVYNGQMDLTGTPEDKNAVWPHKCSNPSCGYEKKFTEKFPTFRVLRT